MSGQIRVLVADDHPSIRENLRALLEAEPDLDVIEVAKNGHDALRKALDLDPDVLVVDVEMPYLDGVDIAKRLRRERPSIRVVAYTADSAACDLALRAGARACVTKDAASSVLLQAVRDAIVSEPGELGEAIAAGTLDVAFQPLVELRGGGVARLEALCRWPHGTGGEVPPSRFIAVAEAHGLITRLTAFVVRRSALAARDWRAERPSLVVNFNLSLATLLDPVFEAELAQLLRETACDPRALGVEITETMLMRRPAATARALGRLRSLGLRVEIDDFGTGYSSLGRLIDLPIDALKIDRRFVIQMTRDHKSASIVRACINLAHDLGHEVVAEGVETTETWELLRALGCDTAQGHFIAAPLATHEVPDWFSRWERRRAALAGPGLGVAAGLPLKPEFGDVLVVDDEPAIAEMIRDVLQHEGFRVVLAANGAEALREVERMPPSVVLLDMQMPIVDGPAFARALRDRGLNVPIVVMTAGSSAAKWADEIRADAYLAKPFDIDGLVAVASRFAVKN
jgi:EAL domain-containing protein (putative c-di-GMP-specific phosphodiesterase class I)/CheY-like chemotaxis protein